MQDVKCTLPLSITGTSEALVIFTDHSPGDPLVSEGEEPGRLLPFSSNATTPSLDAIEDLAGRIAMLGVTATLASSAFG